MWLAISLTIVGIQVLDGAPTPDWQQMKNPVILIFMILGPRSNEQKKTIQITQKIKQIIFM
jgi:mannitol/fructose-specific phosphotransferase system IIA component (Ntr-type)